jgi:hypothetical protein
LPFAALQHEQSAVSHHAGVKSLQPYSERSSSRLPSPALVADNVIVAAPNKD